MITSHAIGSGRALFTPPGDRFYNATKPLEGRILDMTTVRDNLIAARALIADPAKWLQFRFTDGRGCFCIAGALRQATGEWDDTPEWKAALTGALPVELGEYSPVYLNDNPNTTHADIMALFDRAIAAQGETP